MRRAERQVTDFQEILAIINGCKVLRLGMVDDKVPYVVPMNFGYESDDNQSLLIYLHSAQKGRKLEMLESSRQVCVEMDRMIELTMGESGCDYSCLYESLIGWGQVEILEEPVEKSHGLQMIMKHQTGRDDFSFAEKVVAVTCVMQIRLDVFTVKRH
ncbi:pyridoxamine 5'-phosphate oxidase family protein [Eubacteriaceae bacterium ES2]|nr:pyridoxamine 5'-phosphate oxidase family protein [Eubacteriaceae bacterium ES2]